MLGTRERGTRERAPERGQHQREGTAPERGHRTRERAPVIGGDPDPDLISLSEALNKLESVDPRKTAIVEMRYFAGRTIEETAEHLDISSATVVREWRIARAWLYRELGGELETPAPVSQPADKDRTPQVLDDVEHEEAGDHDREDLEIRRRDQRGRDHHAPAPQPIGGVILPRPPSRSGPAGVRGTPRIP